MYAIVKVGGKQYRVEKGDSLLVDRMSEDEGAKVARSAATATLVDGADVVDASPRANGAGERDGMEDGGTRRRGNRGGRGRRRRPAKSEAAGDSSD